MAGADVESSQIRPVRARAGWRARIVLYGFTGCGKSTSAAILCELARKRGLTVEIVKLAEPLYRLQHAFYAAAGLADGGAQDQALLEVIARELRRLSPTSLVDDFLRRLDEATADVVVNDDLRDPYVDYPVLQRDGFRFVRLVCAEDVRRRRLAGRGDLSTVVESATTVELDAIAPDHVVDNSINDRTHLESSLAGVLDRLL